MAPTAEAGEDAAADDGMSADVGAAADVGTGAEAGRSCGSAACASGQVCCEMPAPGTGYCTLECIAAPGCPLLSCVLPPDGGAVDASWLDGGSIDATPADATSLDAAPASCKDVACGPMLSCCDELIGGKCTPKCVPNGQPCSTLCSP
jgi:hypothetical protein